MEDWYRITYEVFLVLSITTTMGIAFYAWRQRTVAGRRPFAIMLLIASLLLLARFIEMVQPTLEDKRPWANVQYGLMAILPVLLFVFVLLYTGHTRWLRRPALVLLLIVPAFTWVLLLTNRYHNLVWESTYLRIGWAKLWLDRTYGPWGSIQDAYTLMLLASTVGVLVADLLRAQRYYVGQIAVLLLAILMPAFSEIVVNAQIQLDLLPYTVMISGLLVLFGLFRFRLLNLAPLARATVIEGMSSGMLVLDELGRVVDVNPTALRIVGKTGAALIGQPIVQVLSSWPELAPFCALSARATAGVVMRTAPAGPSGSEPPATHWYEVRSSPLLSRRGAVNGALLLLSDITELKRAEQVLQRQLHIEMLAATISARFINADPANIGPTLQNTLREMRQLFQADCAYINLLSPNKQGIGDEYCWCAEELSASNSAAPALDLAASKWALRKLRALEVLNVARVAELPDQAASERAHWQRINVQSFLAVPLVLDGGMIGYFGFVMQRVPRVWEFADIAPLKLVGEMLVQFVMRQRAEIALRESEQRLRRITDNMLDLIAQVDRRSVFTYVSPSYRALLGYLPDDLLDKPVADIVHPDDQEKLAALALRAPDLPATPVEVRYRRADGAYLWMESIANTLYDEQGNLAGAVMASRDISDRKRAEEQRLRERRAMTILEERERLARELHDSIGQSLGYVKLQSLAARDALARGDVPMADALLKRLIESAQDTQIVVRQDIRSLFTRPLDSPNFLNALRDYIEHFRQDCALEVQANLPAALSNVELFPHTGAQLLRIIQEALANVRRHSGAHRVSITLSVGEEGQIEALIGDDGCGFDVDNVRWQTDQHFGLDIMRARAQEIGGHLQIVSRPGAGTQVYVRVPARKAQAPASQSDECYELTT